MKEGVNLLMSKISDFRKKLKRQLLRLKSRLNRQRRKQTQRRLKP